MRLIRLTTNYPSYLNQFYAQRPELKEKTYAVQYQTLMADCFGWADFWTHALHKLGYEVWEIVGNAEQMQKAWAREKGVSFKENSWMTDIIAAQVKSFQPDVVFPDDHGVYQAGFIHHLRQECPSIKLVMGWCGAPYSDASVFNAHDIVLSNIPELVEDFRDRGHQSAPIKHAFEPRLLNQLDIDLPKTINFSFIGSISKGQLFHSQREILLKKLVEKTNLEIWSSVERPTPQKVKLIGSRQAVYDSLQVIQKIPLAASFVKAIPKVSDYANLKERPSLSQYYVDAAIAERAHSPVFGIEMFQTLRNTKVTLNNHIDISSRSASNMRMFEATGVGTCLLTDWKENLHDLFEPDREIVTYRSAEECIEKVNWLIERPQEREAIARAGQARTLRDHTFDQRAVQLDEIIKKNIKTISY